jgi:hypothetical protein
MKLRMDSPLWACLGEMICIGEKKDLPAGTVGLSASGQVMVGSFSSLSMSDSALFHCLARCGYLYIIIHTENSYMYLA